jgi:hypothetical protein
MSGEFSRKRVQESQEIVKAEKSSEEVSSEESVVEESSPVKMKKKKTVETDMINSEDSEWDDQDLIKKAIYEATSELSDEGPKKTKKKGVGYTTEIGEIWDVNAYLKLKETKNASLLRVFRII